MKKQIILKSLSFAILIFTLNSCKKDPAKTSLQEEQIEGTVLKSGNFVSNGHPTSGTVKLVTSNNADSIHLVFENFATDAGPDLRVWISSSTDPVTYKEIGILKATNGNFSYKTPISFDYTNLNKVLIWCIDFSVLFGHATLN